MKHSNIISETGSALALIGKITVLAGTGIVSTVAFAHDYTQRSTTVRAIEDLRWSECLQKDSVETVYELAKDELLDSINWDKAVDEKTAKPTESAK